MKTCIVIGCVGFVLLSVILLVLRKIEHKLQIKMDKKIVLIGMAGVIFIGAGICFLWYSAIWLLTVSEL